MSLVLMSNGTSSQYFPTFPFVVAYLASCRILFHGKPICPWGTSTFQPPYLDFSRILHCKISKYVEMGLSVQSSSTWSQLTATLIFTFSPIAPRQKPLYIMFHLLQNVSATLLGSEPQVKIKGRRTPSTCTASDTIFEQSLFCFSLTNFSI